MITQISWKNVWRNKARSLVIISAVSLGLFGGIFAYALMMGGTLQRIDSAIKNETACVQIHNPAFLLDEDLKNSIPELDKIETRLKEVPEIKGFSERLISTGMISTAYASSGLTVNGIYPEKEKQVTRLSESMMKGKYLNKKDQIPIVIGRKMAEKLNVELGDKLILSVPQMDGNVAYGAFILKGIYNTHNDMFDGVQAFVKKSDLSKLLGVDEQSTSEIAISLYDTKLSKRISKSLQKDFEAEINDKALIIRDWKLVDPTLALMVDTMDFFSWIFVGIILIALAFGIINTMLMVVLERVREIGMLMAVGMNKLKIFSMIMWETIFLSITGGIIGILLSFGVISYFQYYGLDLSSVAKGMNAFGYSAIVHPEAPISFYIEVSFMIMLTAILASIYPALKALKLNPAEAIRD
jgi:ABC-type lipoprotein release transport system permease subunit